MAYITFAFISALAVSFLFMPLLINILRKENLFDERGARKIHKGDIPSMGGIVILAAFTFAILAWLPGNPFFARKYVLGAIFLIAMLGIRDDFEPVLPRQKLIVQFIAAGIIVFLANIRFHSLYGFLGVEAIPDWLSYTISVLFITFVTNAFNLIDGIDGLAGSIGAIGLGIFGLWFYSAGYPEYSIAAIALMGSVIGFLYYNWYPAVIFMGDTGSLIIGFTLSICSIWLVNLNASLPAESWLHFDAPFSLTLGVLLFSVFDTLRVFILRIRQRKSPFMPDRQHTHHQVLRMTGNHGKATITIISVYLTVFATITALAKILTDNILMPLIVTFCIALDLFLRNRLYRFIRKKQNKTNSINTFPKGI